MNDPKVNGNDIKQALAKYGSLKEANLQLQKENSDLEQRNNQLREENGRLYGENQTQITEKDGLKQQMVEMLSRKREAKAELQSIDKELIQQLRQYELYCGFMLMVIGSPPVLDSISTIIGIFETLKRQELLWPKSADELRGFFIHSVMGDYLKSFRCDNCGCSFIVNGKPSKTLGNSYECPACHFGYGVKDDDAFFKALASPERIKNTVRIDEALAENEHLVVFRGFNKAICEICGKPVTEWTDENVGIAVAGIGFGHADCWNSPAGTVKAMKKSLQPSIKTDVPPPPEHPGS